MNILSRNGKHGQILLRLRLRGSKMNLEEFIMLYNGKKVDYDHAYGPQCFTKDHCVLMSDWTYKPIQDIKVGDKVIGYDNNVNTVTHLFQNEKEVVHIKTDLSDFYVTEDHPFYFRNGEFMPATSLAEEKPALFDMENFKSSGLTDEELKFFGFWLGDGNIGKHHDGRTDEIRITYGIKKKQFVDSLGVTGNERKHHECDNAFVSGLLKRDHPQLTDIILKYCSDEKKLPLIFTNREYGLILQGFIKADGSLKHNSYVVTNTSLPLLMSFQAACILLGYSTKSIRLSKRSNGIIRINGKQVKSVKPLYRLTISEKSNKSSRTYGEILEIRKETVYNLETDGTHTYICNNHKVHNCVDLARQYFKDVENIKEHTGSCTTSGGAKDMNLDYDKMPVEKKYFKRIPATRNPKTGDTAIWNSTNSNEYGHVAIVVHVFDDSLVVFEQNGIKQDGAKMNIRSRENLLGYLRRR